MGDVGLPSGRLGRLERSGFVQMRPEMLFMNRLQFGFYSVLARLDVDVDYASIEEQILTGAGLRHADPLRSRIDGW